jgi:hypothetical protein
LTVHFSFSSCASSYLLPSFHLVLLFPFSCPSLSHSLTLPLSPLLSFILGEEQSKGYGVIFVARTDALSAKRIEYSEALNNPKHVDYPFIDFDKGMTSDGNYYYLKQGINPETGNPYGLDLAIVRMAEVVNQGLAGNTGCFLLFSDCSSLSFFCFCSLLLFSFLPSSFVYLSFLSLLFPIFLLANYLQFTFLLPSSSVVVSLILYIEYVWMETPNADLRVAKAFIDGVNGILAKKGKQAKMLYNHSPSFDWDLGFVKQGQQLGKELIQHIGTSVAPYFRNVLQTKGKRDSQLIFVVAFFAFCLSLFSCPFCPCLFSSSLSMCFPYSCLYRSDRFDWSRTLFYCFRKYSWLFENSW